MDDPLKRARVGVVGATGAVGRLTLDLLAQRGCAQVRVFASERSAGRWLPYGHGTLAVEEATPQALAAADLDLCLFSVGTDLSRELVPFALEGGALVVDKSSAYRLEPGIPLIVPEVNGQLVAGHRLLANPNCCAIPLSCVLKPLLDTVGLARVRVATYQSHSGAGAQAMERLAGERPADHDLRMDWEFDGEEFDEEAKLRDETRKILSRPELPLQAACMRVPVMVGHAEAVWLETDEHLSDNAAVALLAGSPAIQIVQQPTPGQAQGQDTVLVGRVRRDPTVPNGLALLLACDNLRKGAALNALQIAERALARPRALGL